MRKDRTRNAKRAGEHSVVPAVPGKLILPPICGEFITGSDNGDLDNVVMGAVPEPQTWALWLAGLAGIGVLARRRGQASGPSGL